MHRDRNPLHRWLLLAFVAGATGARADGLEWWSHHFAGTLEPLQPTVEVAFGFRNPSSRTVTIRRVDTNCDCLTAITDRADYPPGATGVLTARFTVGERTGPYTRTITVATDEPGPPQRLTLEFEVPAAAKVEPARLEWAAGAEPRELTADVRPVAGLEIYLDAAVPGATAFAARLETVEPGRHYRLHVRPVGRGPASASIRLTGRTRGGAPVACSAFATAH